jgi:hypothetical protein
MHNLAYTVCGFHMDCPEGWLKAKPMIGGLPRKFLIIRALSLVSSSLPPSSGSEYHLFLQGYGAKVLVVPLSMGLVCSQ